MSGLVKQVALVSLSAKVSLADTLKISAALQKQIVRDFSPIWQVRATIDAFASLDDVPPGYWPIIIMDNIGVPGAGGIHLDRNGQPYALVMATQGTSLTCSHELLEMLADPFGNRLVASDSIKPGQGRVNYLVEICDPSEAGEFGYSINGIAVSDFYTPHYFDPVALPGVRYSFTGALKKPKQVLKGGYLSWIDPISGQWWQALFMGTAMTFSGPHNWKLDSGKSLREVVDSFTFAPRKKMQGKALPIAPPANMLFSMAVGSASNAWAQSLMEDMTQKIAAAKALQ
jgi:hypothetical protein